MQSVLLGQGFRGAQRIEPTPVHSPNRHWEGVKRILRYLKGLGDIPFIVYCQEFGNMGYWVFRLWGFLGCGGLWGFLGWRGWAGL